MELEQVLESYNQEPISLRRCRLSHWKSSVKKFLRNKKTYNVRVSSVLKTQIVWLFKNKVVLKAISKQLNVSAETVRKVVSNSVLNVEINIERLKEDLEFEISLLTDYEKEMLKNYGVIYMVVNCMNGMFYIGKTIKKGAKYEKYFGGGTLINRVIKKHKRLGKSSEEVFCKHIIKSCFDKKELDEAEIQIIADWNAVERDDCYNILEGGEGRSSRCSDQKILEKQKKQTKECKKDVQKYLESLVAETKKQRYERMKLFQRTVQKHIETSKLGEVVCCSERAFLIRDLFWKKQVPVTVINRLLKIDSREMFLIIDKMFGKKVLLKKHKELMEELDLPTDIEKKRLDCYGVICLVINRMNGMFDVSKTTKKGREYKEYFGGSRGVKKEVADCKRKGLLPEEVFCKHILCSCVDRLELKAKKAFFIKQFNAVERKDSYNEAVGGKGDWSRVNNCITHSQNLKDSWKKTKPMRVLKRVFGAYKNSIKKLLKEEPVEKLENNCDVVNLFVEKCYTMKKIRETKGMPKSAKIIKSILIQNIETIRPQLIENLSLTFDEYCTRIDIIP